MKAKIFLLVSLVLLAVQGWAAPPDSLLTRASGLIPYPDPNPSGLHNVTDDPITGPEGINNNTAYTVDFDPTQLKPVVRDWCEAYDITTWQGSGTEYMGFSFGCVNRMNIKVLLGEETDFFLRAFQGNLHYPLTIRMIEGQGVFDFQTTTIYPYELTELDSTMSNFPEWPWSKWCGKTMTIGFHPTNVGTYTAKFKVSGQTSENGIVDKVIEMKVTVVDDLEEHSIYYSPSTIKPFECNVGGTDTQHFTIKAKNISGPLTVYLDDDCDVWWDYFDSKIPLPHVNLKQTGGRFSFTIVGSDVVQPDPINNIYYEQSIISAEDAAQGATLTIKYDPKILGGNHNAKAVITGDGVTAQIHLRGHAPTSSVTVSENKLTFPNYDIDYSDPLSSIWTQDITVTGSNLLGPLVLNVTDDGGNAIDKDMFSYSIDFIGGDVIDVSEAARGAKVQVRYNPTEPGVHRAKITISEGVSVRAVVHLIGTNDPENPTPTVTVSPPSLSFPNATVGETTQPKTLMVWGNNLTSDLTLTPPETTGTNGYFTISRERISADEANEAYQAGHGIPVLVTFTPTEAGNTSGRFIISGGGASSVTVPLSGSALPAAPHVSPESLTFTDVVVGEYRTDHFTVQGSDLTSNLELTITPASGVFSINKTVITPEQAASGQTITVTYTPVAEGTQTATVTISGGGATGSKTVRLTGTAVVREIDANPAALTFSKQTVGEPVTKSFTVTATNPNAPLTLKLNDNTGMFSFVGSNLNTITIPADEAANGAEVSVTYKPTSAGSHVASITITGGGALEEKIVSLIGSAVNRDITTTPPSWDFENVALNVPKSKNIIIRADNLTGPLTLELTQRPNLGMYDISKRTITAEEAANGTTVTVYYTPTAVGQHNATITISGGGAPTKYVSITGTGVVPTITTSETQLNFGTVLKDESKPLTFTVTGTDLTDKLTLSSSNSYFTVSPTSISKEDAALGVLVTVTYKPTATGNHSGTITLSSEGVSATVNVSGKCVVPTITVDQSSLNFGTIEAGKTATMELNVTGSYLTGSITVDKEESDGNQFSINKRTLQASGGTIIVTFAPTEAGTFSGRVRISGGGATPVSVPLTGSARELVVSPTSLNFGTVNEDATPTQTFRVTGTKLSGSLTLALSGATGKYTISPTTITAAQATSGVDVTVTYKPGSGGSHNATVTISGGGVDSKTVSLTGKCAAITPSTTSLNFGDVQVGQTVTKKITVTGINLTSSLALTMSQTGAHGSFTVSPTTIDASQAVNGVTVSVKCTATEAGSISGTLKISGGSAKTKYVSLSGTAVNPTPVLTVSPTSLTFHEYGSKSFTVKGSNLTGDVSLSVSGQTQYFRGIPTTITKSAATSGKEVVVTCDPPANQNVSATVTISSPGATSRTVKLYFTLTRGSIYSDDPNGEGDIGEDEFTNGSQDAYGDPITNVNELLMGAKVYAKDLIIIIESPVEQSAVISDIAGHVWNVDLQKGRNEIPVNASGVFIVRIREKTTKLLLK